MLMVLVLNLYPLSCMRDRRSKFSRRLYILNEHFPVSSDPFLDIKNTEIHDIILDNHELKASLRHQHISRALLGFVRIYMTRVLILAIAVLRMSDRS